MKKPNQMTKCFYGCVIITLITIGFACCQNKSKTDKYNDEIKKIETGENLSKKGNYSATKYGIFATDCTNLRRFKTTKGGLLAKID